MCYVWLVLASKGGHVPSQKAAHHLAKIMTPSQRKKAEAQLSLMNLRIEQLTAEKNTSVIIEEKELRTPR